MRGRWAWGPLGKGSNAMGLRGCIGAMGLGAVHGAGDGCGGCMGGCDGPRELHRAGDGPRGCTGGEQWACGLHGAGREEGPAGWC